MPLFNLRCDACHFEQERLFKTMDQYNEWLLDGVCPECGSTQYYRVPSKLGYRRDHTVNP